MLPEANQASQASHPVAPSRDTAWHALDPATALQRLASDATMGLTALAVAQRSAEHGPNALPEAPQRSLFLVFLRQFKSPLIYILIVAASLAAGMGHFGDAGVILGVVLANALIGAYQEGRAERSMAALRRLSAVQVRVLRDGPRAGDCCPRAGAGRPPAAGRG